MRYGLLLFMLLLSNCVAAMDTPPAAKILRVRVDEIGLIVVGRDTVGSDQLARYIQERLFKSYMGTGEMHDRISIETESAATSDIVIEVIKNEIKEGQRKALQELCLQKYRKTFEMLDGKKQSKLKKQFPVLFQDNFTPHV